MDKLMTEFDYGDRRISHLLQIFDDHVRLIKEYDGHFGFASKKEENMMMTGFRNEAYGILFSMFQLGHLTTGDFHMRLHALNTTYFRRTGY